VSTGKVKKNQKKLKKFRGQKTPQAKPLVFIVSLNNHELKIIFAPCSLAFWMYDLIVVDVSPSTGLSMTRFARSVNGSILARLAHLSR
tara:strand:+ start:118 stop:381 length:264 start_codon:yes stop_codon:yes gene_type:complete